MIEPEDPLMMLGNKVVFGLALELATLIIKAPLSVTPPVPKLPVPAALPTCKVVFAVIVVEPP